jgi:hypothetical protein
MYFCFDEKFESKKGTKNFKCQEHMALFLEIEIFFNSLGHLDSFIAKMKLK